MTIRLSAWLTGGLLLTSSLLAQATSVNWCYRAYYVIGLVTNHAASSNQIGAFSVVLDKSYDKKTDDYRVIYSLEGSNDLTTTNGRALYAMALAAMSNHWLVDFGNDQGDKNCAYFSNMKAWLR